MTGYGILAIFRFYATVPAFFNCILLCIIGRHCVPMKQKMEWNSTRYLRLNFMVIYATSSNWARFGKKEQQFTERGDTVQKFRYLLNSTRKNMGFWLGKKARSMRSPNNSLRGLILFSYLPSSFNPYSTDVEPTLPARPVNLTAIYGETYLSISFFLSIPTVRRRKSPFSRNWPCRARSLGWLKFVSPPGWKHKQQAYVHIIECRVHRNSSTTISRKTIITNWKEKEVSRAPALWSKWV